MKGEEIFNLQKVLHWDPRIYPEGQMTGYFGELTEAAVKRFQKKYGIRTTGEVGPQTRAKLNDIYNKNFAVAKPGLPGQPLVTVSGDVYNNTPFTWKKGQVVVILCDDNNHYLAAGITPLTNLYSAKSTKFSVQWYQGNFPEKIRVCEKEAYINVLDKDNAVINLP